MDKVIDRKHKDFEEVLNICIHAIQGMGGNIDFVEDFKNDVESIQFIKDQVVLNFRQPEDD